MLAPLHDSKPKDGQNYSDDKFFKQWVSFVHFPAELLLYITWCYLFWKGTKYEVLFSRKNHKILLIVGVLDFSIHGYSVYGSYRLG